MNILLIPFIYIIALLSFQMNCTADVIDKVDTGACKIVEILTFNLSK